MGSAATPCLALLLSCVIPSFSALSYFLLPRFRLGLNFPSVPKGHICFFLVFFLLFPPISFPFSTFLTSFSHRRTNTRSLLFVNRSDSSTSFILLFFLSLLPLFTILFALLSFQSYSFEDCLSFIYFRSSIVRSSRHTFVCSSQLSVYFLSFFCH